jgi:hypothetical protein
MAGAFEASTTQAQLHNFIVGTAGTEAEQARRRAGFQLGGELGQLVEEAVIVHQFSVRRISSVTDG